ncbi:hypothetical protein [Capnocytophaga ochracea]
MKRLFCILNIIHNFALNLQPIKMRIIAKKAIVDFYTLHSGAKIPLEDWYKKAISAE